MTGWVSVDERVPDHGNNVLVYPGWATSGDEAGIESYARQYKCFLMEIEDGKRVTHWMELPKP